MEQEDDCETLLSKFAIEDGGMRDESGENVRRLFYGNSGLKVKYYVKGPIYIRALFERSLRWDVPFWAE